MPVPRYREEQEIKVVLGAVISSVSTSENLSRRRELFVRMTPHITRTGSVPRGKKTSPQPTITPLYR